MSDQADTTTNDPITLANVDDYLHHQDLFLPHHDDQGPTPHEIDAAITNASNSMLEEHNSSSLDQPGGQTGHNDLDTSHHPDNDEEDGHEIDPSLMDDMQQHQDDSNDDSNNAQASSSRAGPSKNHTLPYKRRVLSEDAVHNPATNLAPFIKPQRSEDSPHPEQIYFAARDDFEEWLKGESSWCHYVQRRVTNPEKRAEERLKSRIRAHERAVAAMDPEQQASAPALKRRRRNRTSAVKEKVTYTCHHAGTYSSKHSEDLPQAKLRMNTKQSVKCSCSSRIVLTEVESGDCQVMYYWKHEGHDPFASAELEAGRLPKVVDDWLNQQILDGFTVDQIRAKLDMSPEDKEEYIRKATEDPSYVTPQMPPALAFSVKVKYPDIYNRFRKMRGPVKETKVPKSHQRSKRRKTNGDETEMGMEQRDSSVDDNHLLMNLYEDTKGNNNVDEGLEGLEGLQGDIKHVDGDVQDSMGQEGEGEAGPSTVRAHDHDHDHSDENDHGMKNDTHSHILDPQIMADETPSMLHTEDVDHQFDEHLARLASDGQLAEALLRLPQGSTDHEGTSGSTSNAHHQNMHQGIGVGVGVGSGSGPSSGAGAGAGAGTGGGGAEGTSGNGNLDMGQDDEVEENLREAVLRMARAERADWDSMVQQ